MSKKVISHTTQVINSDSGEVQEVTKSISIKAASTEEFFMMFVKHMAPFFNLRSLVDMKVLIKFCQIAEYNTGVVLLPTGLRKDICVELGINTPHLSNAIKRLKDHNLISGEQGQYKLNEVIAWKGEVKERDKEIKKNYKLNFRLEYISKAFE